MQSQEKRDANAAGGAVLGSAVEDILHSRIENIGLKVPMDEPILGVDFATHIGVPHAYCDGQLMVNAVTGNRSES